MITKEQWLNLVSKVDQTFEDEFKAEYNSPELMFPVVQRLLKQCNVSGRSEQLPPYKCPNCEAEFDNLNSAIMCCYEE